MKCKNKEICVRGIEYNDKQDTVTMSNLRVIVTNDEKGKSISIDNGEVQFTIPFEPLQQYMEGDYRA
jgi:hypothetical protein